MGTKNNASTTKKGNLIKAIRGDISSKARGDISSKARGGSSTTKKVLHSKKFPEPPKAEIVINENA